MVSIPSLRRDIKHALFLMVYKMRIIRHISIFLLMFKYELASKTIKCLENNILDRGIIYVKLQQTEIRTRILRIHLIWKLI